MRRDEVYDGVTGLLVGATEFRDDGTTATLVYDPDGNVVSESVAATPPTVYPPLDEAGALATLLVVTGVLTLQDAANAVHEEPEHLEAEALAWEAASTPPV